MMELMVAIGVLLVAVMSAFSSQITSMNLVTTSRETSTAMTELQACMESILTEQTDQIPLADSPYAEGVPIAGYDSLQNEVLIATYPDFPDGSNDPRDVPDPLEITLTVAWTDYQGRPRSLSLTSIKTQ